MREKRPPLDPEPDEMRRLGHDVVDLVVDYLATLSELPVARPGSREELSAQVDEPLPRKGRGAESSFEFFLDRVAPGMTRVNHPRFHAYIPSPGSFYSTLGAVLAAGTNPFAGSWLGAGSIAALELVVLRWISEAIGYPTDAAGVLTSGGSVANLSAVAAARASCGEDTLSDGVLYFSEEGHASAEKGARLLGYPAVSLRRIPVDGGSRMDLPALSERIHEDRQHGRRPFFVCANAGTINTGAIDHLEAIAELCRREHLWFHVDGAYGGFAAICPEGRRRLAGMEQADSLTLDPHKWLGAPMGTGCLLVRERAHLEGAFQTHGDYLRDIPTGEVNFFDRGPELSRPGRVLSVWMLLRSVGLDALALQVEWDLKLARLAASLLAEDPRLEVYGEPPLSIVAFGHRCRAGESEESRARRDDALVKRVLEDGTLMISSTTLAGRRALRLVVMNHRTSESELRRSLRRLKELLDHPHV